MTVHKAGPRTPVIISSSNSELIGDVESLFLTQATVFGTCFCELIPSLSNSVIESASKVSAGFRSCSVTERLAVRMLLFSLRWRFCLRNRTLLGLRRLFGASIAFCV